MRARLLAGSIALLGVCAPVAAQTVLNGSFEEPVVTSGYFLNVASSFSGWTLNYGDVDTVREFGGSEERRRRGSRAWISTASTPGRSRRTSAGSPSAMNTC